MIIPNPVSRAWGALPRGNEGPCAFACGHASCHAQIQFAGDFCLCCNQPLGFEQEFMEFYDGRAVHVKCPPRVKESIPPPKFWQRLKLMFKGEIG